MEFRLEPALERRDPSSVITAVALDDDGGRIFVGEKMEEKRYWTSKSMALKKKAHHQFFLNKNNPHRHLRRCARRVESPLKWRPRRAGRAEACGREQKSKEKERKRAR